jgi:hypothetical protein
MKGPRLRRINGLQRYREGKLKCGLAINEVRLYMVTQWGIHREVAFDGFPNALRSFGCFFAVGYFEVSPIDLEGGVTSEKGFLKASSAKEGFSTYYIKRVGEGPASMEVDG